MGLNNKHSRPFKKSRGTRSAFTLVELLVVVAIIGILIGMLIPAIQQVREAARRTVCMNKASQVALACHNYEFSHEHFPPGVTDKAGPILNQEIGLHVGFLVDLLVYIEQRGIANNFDVTIGTYAPANIPAREQEIELYMCPSFTTSFGATTAGTSNYAGCHNDVETPIDVDNNGILFLNSRIGFEDIYDGSSNTILIGEIAPLDSDLGWASGTRATLRNASEMIDEQIWKTRNLAGANANDFVGGFGSHHNWGATFAMADGSVQFKSKNIHQQHFEDLANREDGAMMGSHD